jgi:hypothetical protein
MYKLTLPKNHRSIGETIKSMAATYDDKGDYEKALRYYSEALDIFKQTLPSNHSSITETIAKMLEVRMMNP